MVKSKIYVGLLALAAVVMLLLVGCGASSQTPKTSLVVKVISKNYRTGYIGAVENALVSIQSAEGNTTVKSGYTTSLGSVEFSDIPAGKYKVNVTKQGYTLLEVNQGGLTASNQVVEVVKGKTNECSVLMMQYP